MEFSRLLEFTKLAKSCDFGSAAKECGLNKSTLSRHIQQLEQELNVVLFERTTHSVTLSKYGQLILPYVQQILEEEQQYLAALQNQTVTGSMDLTIGLCPWMGSWLHELIADFEKEYPEMNIKVISDSSNRVRGLLEQNNCSVAFFGATETESHAEWEKLICSTDQFAALLPNEHPLAKEKAIRLEQLKDDSFFLVQPSFLDYIVAACKRSGFEPCIKKIHASEESIVFEVEREKGVSIVMRGPVERRAGGHDHVAIVSIEPPMLYYSIMAYDPRRISKPLANFLEYFRMHRQTGADKA